MNNNNNNKKQTHDAVGDAPVPDVPAHRPGDAELPADADLHDVQHVAVSGRGARCRPRVLPVWLEKVGDCRRHRALPLARPAANCCCGDSTRRKNRLRGVRTETQTEHFLYIAY